MIETHVDGEEWTSVELTLEKSSIENGRIDCTISNGEFYGSDKENYTIKIGNLYD